ncbi:MAG TPA: NF038122 family metalloprotease [Candidatus Binatia bacterium]|nr:NF038122 family metalloprotease [Candidatus Binatia bacterium]
MRTASLLPALVVAAMTTAAAVDAAGAGEITCPTAQSDPPVATFVSSEELRSARRPVQRGGGFSIELVAGPGIAANAAALAAFERAAAQWEAVFSDPMTVSINVDLTDLGSPTIIGAASSVLLGSEYDQFRSDSVDDSWDEPDDGVTGFLPYSEEFAYTMPPGFSASSYLIAGKAVFKALGYTGLDDTFGTSDGSINFNSQFSFDFNNANGVTAGTQDFETVAAHEIGHILGFVSSIDQIDELVHSGTTSGVIAIRPLDLYRFLRSGGSDPVTTANFTTFARSVTYNVDAALDDLDGEYRMSTGVHNGDGRQASHWKDDDLVGTHLGVMDPTLSSGTAFDVEATDVRALDLIGYETHPCGNGTVDPGEDCDDASDCCGSNCLYEPQGTACSSDGQICTNDVCSGGAVCQHLFDPKADLTCSSCPNKARAGCTVAAKSTLSIANASAASDDAISWKWGKGETTGYADFGQPDDHTFYRLCFYDDSGFITSLDVDNREGWKGNAPKSWTYADAAATTDGVTSIKLGAGTDGKAKQQWKAKGGTIVLPGPFGSDAFFDLSGPVVVQVHANDHCWSSTFLPDSFKLNTAARVKAASSTFCGDETATSGEECDGRDDDACPGDCLPSCVCAP